jgi:hypothetical protein
MRLFELAARSQRVSEMLGKKCVKQGALPTPGIPQDSDEDVPSPQQDAARFTNEVAEAPYLPSIWQRLFAQMKGFAGTRYHPERHYMRGPGPATIGKRGPGVGQ